MTCEDRLVQLQEEETAAHTVALAALAEVEAIRRRVCGWPGDIDKADTTAIYLHVTPARPRETYNAAQGWVDGRRVGRGQGSGSSAAVHRGRGWEVPRLPLLLQTPEPSGNEDYLDWATPSRVTGATVQTWEAGVRASMSLPRPP
jgi:hypothetical protein